VRPLSPWSPAWLLAMVTTSTPESAIASARRGSPLKTTSFQYCGSPLVVSGVSRLTKARSALVRMPVMPLKTASPPWFAMIVRMERSPMTSPPATIVTLVAVGVGVAVANDDDDDAAAASEDDGVAAAGGDAAAAP